MTAIDNTTPVPATGLEVDAAQPVHVDQPAEVEPNRDTAPHTAPHLEETPTTDPTRSGARARARGNRTPPPSGKPSWPRRLVTYFDPPELWTDRRPSLRDVWMYARHGEWTGRGTVGRGLGVVYAVLVAIPAHVVLGEVLFVVERPARHATAWALAVLVALTPPGLFLRRALAALLTLAAQLIA